MYGSAVQQYGDPSQQVSQFVPYQAQQPQMYGQQQCQMRPMQQVPLSPQTSSQYAPSSSSPPLTPLHLAGVSDGSGSPVPMPLTAGPTLPRSCCLWETED